MGIKFKIEFISRLKDGYLLAKIIEPNKDFSLSSESTINGVSIKPRTSIPRAHDKKGNPRNDLFVFWAKRKNDFQIFSEGQIIELN